MAGATCAIQAIMTGKHAKRRESEECVKIGARWGSSGKMSRMRRDIVLRTTHRIAARPSTRGRASIP